MKRRAGKFLRGLAAACLAALFCTACTAEVNTENSLRVLGGAYELQHSFETKFDGAMMIANQVMDAKELAEKIAAGDDSFDLYYVDSTVPGLRQCLEMGAFYPLDELEGIDAYLEKFSPQIRAHCRYKGKLMGLPDSIISSAMAASPELLEEYGDSLKRWDTAMEKGEELFAKEPAKALLGNLSSNQSEMLNQYLASYVGSGPVNLDTPEFRQTLQQMKQAEDYVGFQIPTETHGAYQIMLKRDFLIWTREKEVLSLPPRISEEAKYPLQMRWLMVNPNSPNLELAMDFLAHYIATEDPMEGNNLYYRDADSAWTQVQKENHQVYLDMLEESAVAYCPRDLFGVLNPILQEYYREEIDLETAVTRLNEAAQSVLE